MGRHPTRYSLVPWWLPDSDLVAVGDPELVRDLAGERQVALHVRGSAPGVTLGLVAMRCARDGARLVPLTISLPESPIVVEAPPLRLHSNPRRHKDPS